MRCRVRCRVTMASIATHVDLVLPPVNVSRPGPSKDSFDGDGKVLQSFVAQYAPECSADAALTQKAALLRLKQLFETWAARPVLMFCSGSFRLGVHSASTDIDVLFMTTAEITRDDVFTGFVSVLQSCADVTNLLPVRGTRVPVIGFTLGTQEFDVLTCHLASRVLPARDAVLASYEWMNGLAEADVLGFNGPRVTEMIPNFSKVAGVAFREAQTALRFLRHWAKQRCVYSNKSGFLGGVNLALMLCYVIQRAAPGTRAPVLLARFFDVFAKWAPDEPIVLDAHVDHACPVWLSQWEFRSGASRVDPFTVLTPCFPRFNTMAAATKFTSRTMRAELQRGARVFELCPLDPVRAYAALCAPLEAVAGAQRFLCVRAAAPATRDGIMWLGFIEARVRHLITYLHETPLAIRDFRFIPTWIESRTESTLTRCAYITANDDGIKRPFKISGTLEMPIQYFVKQHVQNGPCKQPVGADIGVSFIYGRDDVPARVLEIGASDVQDEEFARVCAEALIARAVSNCSTLTTVLPGEPRKRPRGTLVQQPFQRASCTKAKNAAGMKMQVRIAPTTVPHPPRSVRPVLLNGSWNAFDVYVGQSQHVAAGRRFEPGVFKLPDDCTDAGAHVALRVETDSTFARHVRGLFGKVLACWCVTASGPAMHPDLARIMGVSGNTHASSCPVPALLAHAARLQDAYTPASAPRKRRR